MIRALCKSLGVDYRVTTIDLERVIYRDFGNGFNVEISGMHTSSMKKKATIYLWYGDQLWKVNHKLVKNFFFISVVKKGNFNRAPLGCFFKIYRYWYTDLLFEVKFDIVGEHLPDDSDKFAGTMPKCIVMRPAFSPLGIIISLEGCVVSDNVPSCIYKGIS